MLSLIEAGAFAKHNRQNIDLIDIYVNNNDI